MKLLTCLYKNKQHLGVLGSDGESAHLLTLDKSWSGASDMLELIDGGRDALDAVRDAYENAPAVALSELTLMAPIPRPRQNVICLGLNYMDHLIESAKLLNKDGGDVKVEPPEALIAFTKAVTCVCGPYDDIPYDAEISKRVDWEVELGVIIGRRGHKVAAEDALDYVFGYTAANDISARELQRLHKQFFISKCLPNSGPIGPWIVTADEIPDPQNLRIVCRVNGDIKQDGNTSEQIFSVRDAISVLSKTPSVEPGDIILTGTPAGVGFARRPAEYLQVGDVVECEVEGIGAVRNKIVAAKLTS